MSLLALCVGMFALAGSAQAATGTISTLAGNGSSAYSGNGSAATSTGLFEPSAVAVDARGDQLISDWGNNAVRLVAASSCSSGCPYGLASMTVGDIYTIAGNGTQGFSGDGGPATSAELDMPQGVAVDQSGNVLIADQQNQRVRLVAAVSCSSGCPYGLASMTKGYIYTIAGNGTFGYSGDGGPATSAELNYPQGLAVDPSGDVLIADEDNHLVRLVAASSCSSGCPYGLASMTAGDIYTIAGNGTFGYSGDGGPATSAELYYPSGLAVDAGGNMLIADQRNQRVRLVAAVSCSSGCPYGLASMTRGDIYTIAGSAPGGFSGDGGPATSAEFNDPQGVAVDPRGDVLIDDYGNSRVRLVAAANCSSGCPYGLASMIKGYVYTVAGNGTAGYSGDGGPASSAALSGPEGVAVEAGGNLLIADTGNDRVRLVTTVGTPSSSVSAPSVGTVGMSISGSAVTAIVSGGYSPSGSVSFRVFGPQAAAPASCAAGGSSVGSGSVAGDGSYSPVGGFTPSGAGDYWWYVSYGGDANNNPAASTCGSGMAETVIANAPPSPHPTAHPGLTVPVLSKLALSTHKLSLSGRRAGGRCVRRDSRNERHRHCQLQLRLKVTFRLSMRASVKFTLRHRLPGRMAKGACIKQTRRDRHERRCTRWVGVRGTLTETRGAGSRSFTFDGKLDGRRLRAGVYQLAASPGAAGERGTAHRITFTIAG